MTTISTGKIGREPHTVSSAIAARSMEVVTIPDVTSTVFVVVDAGLLALTAVTGIVDAVSFLALGRVFTANMTGNVVFLGFAAAGPDPSVTRPGTALLALFVGVVIGGRAMRGVSGSLVSLGPGGVRHRGHIVPCGSGIAIGPASASLETRRASTGSSF